MSFFKELLSDLNPENPYDGIDPVPHESIEHGWGYEDKIFSDLIAQIRPRLIIEVGTWLGMSAINMANLQKDSGIEEPEILCIDTWVGSAPILWNEKNRPFLKLKNGFPQQYFDFLQNIVNSNLTQVVTPFVMTSRNAGEYLQQKGVLVDLIYIDGSHDERDVISDCEAFWPLLRPGGVMLGDDWPQVGVKNGVTKFFNAKALDINVAKPAKWYVYKPT